MQITEIHRDVDVGGLTIRAPFSLALDQVFVDLTLAQRAPHRLSANPLRTEEDQPLAPDSSLDYISRSSAWEFLQGQSRVALAVIGAPGSGKTTLLKHITLALANSRHHNDKIRLPKKTIPILLYLREHDSDICKNTEIKLADLASRSLAGILGPGAAKWIERELRAGRCLVMLDGLDEVAAQTDRAAIVKWVDAQIASYPHTSFIVSSRPHGYQENPLSAATVLQVRALSPEQVDQFVNLWSLAAEIRKHGRNSVVVRQRAKASATDLLRRIEQTPSLRDLAANPLLLTMIMHLHNYGGSLPQNRVQLYHDICQVFLGKRREAKGLASGALTIEQKQVMLRTLALHLMSYGMAEIARRDAESVIYPPLQKVAPDLSASDFLTHIQQDCGLIVEQENNVMAFVHKTIQEYLASEQIHEEGSLKVLTDHLTESWWRETILLYSAQADASPLIRSCLKSKSPTALALAADCVNIARELAPEWRVAVEDAMSDSAGLDEQTRQVIGSALLTRKLRSVIRLSTDTYAIDKPISAAEYLLAADSTARDVERIRRRSSLLDFSNSQMAKGVLGSDAMKFAAWVTNLMADGWSYRLPTAIEAEDPLMAEIIDLEKYAFWRLNATSGPTNFSAAPILDGVVARKEVQASTLMASIANVLNWEDIAVSLATLNPDVRQRLSASWASDLHVRVLPTREPVRNWPALGILSDLLEMVSLVSSFGVIELTQFRNLIVDSGALGVSGFENLMDLVALVTGKPRAELRARRNVVEGDDANSLAYFIIHQCRMDAQRYSRVLLRRFDAQDYERALSRLLRGLQGKSTAMIKSICDQMRVSVDLEKTLGSAQARLRLIDDRDFWRVFSAHREVRERSMFQFCATTVDATLKALANGSMADADSGEALASARMCAMLCWHCTSVWQSNRRSKVSDGGRLLAGHVSAAADAYCRVLSDLHVVEWRFRQFLPTVETLVLVRS